MAVLHVTAGDLRDPMDSAETYSDVEGPVVRDDDGGCYCSPTPMPMPDGSVITELSSVHLHLRVWGRKPDVSPSYFEIPVR
jgi:hypothetical protein